MSRGKFHSEDPSNAEHAQLLRNQAEQQVLAMEARVGAMPPVQDAARLLHELRVHQIELEMQNEELRRAQGELQAARDRYFDLYDLAPVGYLTLSEKGLIQQANLCAATLFGVPRGELTNQPLSKYILPADQDIYYRHRRQLFETHAPQTCELRMLRSRSSTFWASLDATLAETPEHGGLSWRVVVSDISERQHLHEQLLQAHKMQAVGSLAGGIAHDMNNMLAVILGLGSLLTEKLGPTDPNTLYSQAIVQAAEQGKASVERLLGFARRGKYERHTVALNDVVDEVVRMLSRSLSKKIEVRTKLAPDLDVVEGDRGQLIQTLLNLCLNAADALEGVGNITIVTSNQTLARGAVSMLKPGRYVKLQVEDDGLGMNESTLSKAIDPFFTTKDVGKGTGLGLSMSYSVVRNHGGELEITSKLRVGTSVCVWLPSHESARVKPEKPRAALPPITKETDKPKLLIIDDEDLVRTTICAMAQAIGLEAIAASGGESGLELYQASIRACDDGTGERRRVASDIDLVVLDLAMPVMDGRECFKRLKEINPNVQVLISTGYGSSTTVEALLEDGVVGIVQKPFNMRQLSQAIGDALGRKLEEPPKRD